MRQEAIDARTEFMQKVHDLVWESAGDAVKNSTMSNRQALDLAHSVAFGIMTILDGCDMEGTHYTVMRDDGLSISDNMLHDWYYWKTRK